MARLLVDADILVHRSSASAERSVVWNGADYLSGDEMENYAPSDDTIYTQWASFGDARQHFEQSVEDLILATGMSELVFVLSDKSVPVFRKDIVSTYKGNRADVRKPFTFSPLRRYLIDHVAYETVLEPRLEGDDVLGLLAKDDDVIWSIDKDLKGVPGNHWDHEGESVIQISQYEADHFWMTQVLTGDPTDGYKGCPGVGAVKAQRILDGLKTVDEMWDAVVVAYTSKDLTEQDALNQARLARILRGADYDFNQKEIKLWEPNTIAA